MAGKVFMNENKIIALSTTSDNVNKKKKLLLQAAARCHHNGKYEMCAMWISMYKKLVAKYGC
jgi:hypothetical protein